MSNEKKLSDRVRPNIEAAPWVCDEIATLEKRLVEATRVVNSILDADGPYDDLPSWLVKEARTFVENTHD